MKLLNTLSCTPKLNRSSTQSKILKLSPNHQQLRFNSSVRLTLSHRDKSNNLQEEYQSWLRPLWWWKRKKKTIWSLQYNLTKMDAGMKEPLWTAKNTAKENWCSKTAPTIKANSKKTKWTAEASSSTTKTTPPTTDSGQVINSTASEFSSTNTPNNWPVSTISARCARSRITGSNTKVNIYLFRLILLGQQARKRGFIFDKRIGFWGRI